MPEPLAPTRPPAPAHRGVAVLELALGACMVMLWTTLLTTGQVPELTAGSWAIWFHLVAEYGTATVLVLAGGMLLARRGAGRPLSALALGALAYAAVNSAGYYADLDQWAVVGMFAVVTAAALAAATRLLAAPA